MPERRNHTRRLQLHTGFQAHQPCRDPQGSRQGQCIRSHASDPQWAHSPPNPGRTRCKTTPRVPSGVTWFSQRIHSGAQSPQVTGAGENEMEDHTPNQGRLRTGCQPRTGPLPGTPHCQGGSPGLGGTPGWLSPAKASAGDERDARPPSGSNRSPGSSDPIVWTRNWQWTRNRVTAPLGRRKEADNG
jgi:hypothetical protein